MNWFQLSTVIVCCAGLASAARAVDAVPTPAFVRLKPSAMVSQPQVRLGHIAEIVDPSPRRRAQLTELDVATAEAGETSRLSQNFVRVRLLLAGFDEDEVLLLGAEESRVALQEPVSLTDLAVEEAVWQALCREFQLPQAELHVKLASPFMGSWLPPAFELKQVRIEPLPSARLPLGRSQLTLRVLDGERVVAVRMATFEISQRQAVVVATASLERSQVVQATHLKEEIRYVDRCVDSLTSDQLLGRKVLMPVRPGEIVTLRHVSQEAVLEESPVLIQPRDLVRVVARKKNLTVVIPAAEALQAGRKGQLIRLRNPDSNKVVTGRVVGHGEVEVSLE